MTTEYRDIREPSGAWQRATTEAPPKELRCWRCAKKLANHITPPFDIDCPRCHAKNRG